MSPDQSPSPLPISAVILAGGRGSRMGGEDKGLLHHEGLPLIEILLEIITPQVSEVIISANRNLEEYGVYGHQVIQDELAGFQGPLAGVLAAMHAASNDLLLTLPCDGPFVTSDYAQRLYLALSSNPQAPAAVAHDGLRVQPLHALVRMQVKPTLESYLEDGDRKAALWYERIGAQSVNFSDWPELFVNINRPEDRDRL